MQTRCDVIAGSPSFSPELSNCRSRAREMCEQNWNRKRLAAAVETPDLKLRLRIGYGRNLSKTPQLSSSLYHERRGVLHFVGGGEAPDAETNGGR